MSTWLHKIATDIEEVSGDGLPVPDAPVGEGEQELGVATPDQQKLYLLAMRWEKAAAECAIAARFARQQEDKQRFNARGVSFLHKACLIKEGFWIELRDTFHLWEQSVGIRDGWKVVSFEAPTNSILAALETILTRG